VFCFFLGLQRELQAVAELLRFAEYVPAAAVVCSSHTL
jgi:hypothetical protein